jgi:hypothetical protein
MLLADACTACLIFMPCWLVHCFGNATCAWYAYASFAHSEWQKQSIWARVWQTPGKQSASADPQRPALCLQYRTNALVQQYGEIVKQVGAETGASVLDLYPAIAAVDDYATKLLKPDFLHFTEDGSRLVAAMVQNAIEKDYPELG